MFVQFLCVQLEICLFMSAFWYVSISYQQTERQNRTTGGFRFKKLMLWYFWPQVVWRPWDGDCCQPNCGVTGGESYTPRCTGCVRVSTGSWPLKTQRGSVTPRYCQIYLQYLLYTVTPEYGNYRYREQTAIMKFNFYVLGKF